MAAWCSSAGHGSELADHKPGMMTLISLAIIVAFGTSLAATFGLFEIDVWWELASLITIMVLGHWLEMRAISQARGALNALAALLPDTAERVTGAETQSVPLSELRIGDIVLVRPGARVPADGTVVEGAADVDESMITGESKTVPKAAGSKVIAGTVVSGGSLRVRIDGNRGPDGSLRNHAARRRRASVRLPHAGSCRPCSRDTLLRGGRLGCHYFHLLVAFRRQGTRPDSNRDSPRSLLALMPLDLAIPLVIAISTSLGAQNGLLVKDRLALERARNLDMVIFDKTGTLTRGSPAVSGVAAAPGTTEDDLTCARRRCRIQLRTPARESNRRRSRSAAA